MRLPRAPGGVHYRLLLLVCAGGIVLVGGLLAAHALRKQSLLRSALAAGTTAYEHGDWAAARSGLGRWISAHPDDVEALQKYADAHLAADPLLPENLRQATSALRRVLRLQPEDGPTFQRLARLYEAAGNSAELLHIAKRRLEVSAGDATAVLAMAKALAQQRQTSEAISRLTALFADHPPASGANELVVEACLLLAELLEVQPGDQQPEEPLAWLTRAVDCDPQDPLPRAVRSAYLREQSQQAASEGRADQEKSQLDRARADLEQATGLLGTNPRVWLLVAQEWAAHGEPVRARELLAIIGRQCTNGGRPHYIDPTDWLAELSAARAELALRDSGPDEPAALANELLAGLKDRPQRAHLLPLAMQLYVRAGAVEEARRALAEYRDAVRLSPSAAQFEEQLAFLEATLARAEGRYYDVIRLLEPAAVVAIPGTGTMRLLAEAYQRTGQEGRYVRILGIPDRARRLPRDLRHQVARLMIQRGDSAAARDALGSASAAPSAAVDDQVLWWTATISLAAGLDAQAPPELLASAVKQLIELKAAQPARVDIRVLLAATYELGGDADLARSELASAAEQCPEPVAAWMALAELAERTGGRREAVLREACTRSPHSTLWLAFAQALAGANEMAGARQALTQALAAASTDPARRAVELENALLELEHGDRPTGAEKLRQLAAADRGDVSARILLLRWPELNSAEADGLLTELRAIEGEHGTRWRTEQARRWLREPDWRSKAAEATALLEASLLADPSAADAAMLLGETHQRLGNTEAAERIYRGLGTAPARQALLALLLHQQRFSEARALLEQDARGAESNAVARRLLAVAASGADHQLSATHLGPAEAISAADRLLALAALGATSDDSAEAALEKVAEAERAGADPVAVAQIRVAVLSRAGRTAEALASLDNLVQRDHSPGALLLRGAYFSAHGQAEAAERDYIAVAERAVDDLGPAMLGEYYAQAGRFDQAIAAWDAGLARFGDSTRLRRGLAKALLARNAPGDLDRAHSFLGELAKSLPDDVDVLWVRAIERLHRGEGNLSEELRPLITRAAAAETGPAEAFHGLSQIALRIGAVEGARAVAQRGLQLNPNDPDLLIALAGAELAAGDLAAAEELTDTVLRQRHLDLNALEIAAEIALQRQNTGALQRLLESVALAAPSAMPERPLLLQARLLKALGRASAARDLLKDWVGAHPDSASPAALVLLAELHLEAGEAPAARRMLDAIASKLPPGAPRPPAWLQLDLQLLRAEQRFDELAARGEQDPEVAGSARLLILAASLLVESPAHLTAADQACARAMGLEPRSPAAIAAAASIAYRRQDLPGALAYYRQLLALQPDHPEALNNAAWTLSLVDPNTAALHEAEGLARRAVALVPTEPNYRDTLAAVLRRAGKLNDARDESRRGAALAPAGSAVRARLALFAAQLSEALGDRDGVRSDLLDTQTDGAAVQTLDSEQRAEVDRLRAFARSGAAAQIGR